MEAVCNVPGVICLASVLVNTAMVFFIMAPFAATRLLVLRMRAHGAVGLQVSALPA